jgi:hypothetical protein
VKLSKYVPEMKHMRYSIKVLALLSFLLSGLGCLGPMYSIKVDSITSEQLTTKRNYILLPSNEGVNANDLRFQEFSRYIKRSLAQQGLREANDFESANIAIFFGYGIGDPQDTPFSFSLPIYGQTGGGTSTFSATTYGSRGYSTTHGSISSMPTYGIVGSQSFSGTITRYFRYLVMDCFDLDVYRQNKTMQPIWKTIVTSSGRSGDLREVFPVLVTASVPYIGTNTGKQIRVDIYENDNRVKQIKGLEIQKPALLLEPKKEATTNEPALILQQE